MCLSWPLPQGPLKRTVKHLRATYKGNKERNLLTFHHANGDPSGDFSILLWSSHFCVIGESYRRRNFQRTCADLDYPNWESVKTGRDRQAQVLHSRLSGHLLLNRQITHRTLQLHIPSCPQTLAVSTGPVQHWLGVYSVPGVPWVSKRRFSLLIPVANRIVPPSANVKQLRGQRRRVAALPGCSLQSRG